MCKCLEQEGIYTKLLIVFFFLFFPTNDGRFSNFSFQPSLDLKIMGQSIYIISVLKKPIKKLFLIEKGFLCPSFLISYTFLPLSLSFPPFISSFLLPFFHPSLHPSVPSSLCLDLYRDTPSSPFFLALLHSLWDLSSPTRDGTWATALKTQNPNH